MHGFIDLIHIALFLPYVKLWRIKCCRKVLYGSLLIEVTNLRHFFEHFPDSYYLVVTKSTKHNLHSLHNVYQVT